MIKQLLFFNILTVSLAFFGIRAEASGVCEMEATLVINDQDTVNAFVQNYGACDTMPYGLTISGSGITQVDGLSNLQSIRGDLKLSASDLVDISGLSSLTSVEGRILLQGTQLANIDALSNLIQLGGFTASDNPLLENVDGLLGVTALSGFLSIHTNPTIWDIDGLSNLESVEGLVQVVDNDGLTDLNAFAGLQRVGGALTVYGNDALARCEGIAPLLGAVTGVSNVTGRISIGEESGSTNNDNRDGCNNSEEVLASYTSAELTRPNYCRVSAEVVLNNQLLVNAFVQNYGTCDTMPYGLTISGSGITQVDGLSNLQSIRGDLKLSASDLVDISGLSSLTSVEGRILLQGTQLANIDALSSLSELGGFRACR